MTEESLRGAHFLHFHAYLSGGLALELTTRGRCTTAVPEPQTVFKGDCQPLHLTQ